MNRPGACERCLEASKSPTSDKLAAWMMELKMNHFGRHPYMLANKNRFTVQLAVLKTQKQTRIVPEARSLRKLPRLRHGRPVLSSGRGGYCKMCDEPAGGGPADICKDIVLSPGLLREVVTLWTTALGRHGSRELPDYDGNIAISTSVIRL
jgi:hypothetical protein